MFLFPASDLTPFRTLSSLVAVSMLLYGFIAELD
jgi:hypothetical protein